MGLRFVNRVAVVTGGSRGIGLAIVRRFASEGATVVTVDLDRDAGESSTRAIVDDGGKAFFVPGDVGDEGTWDRAIQRAVEVGGHLDVIVNNAYQVVRQPPHEMDTDAWNRQFTVNVTAIHHAVRRGIGELTTQNGSMVNLSSVQARIGIPSHAAYAATKGAIEALTRQLAVQYGPEVRVNAVAPGPINTDAWLSESAHEKELTTARTAAGRLGTPEEVAAAVAFLASDDASFITGAVLAVDGGLSIKRL